MYKPFLLALCSLILWSCEPKPTSTQEAEQYDVIDYRTVKLMLDTLNAERRAQIDSTGSYTIEYTDLSKGKKRLIFFGASHNRNVNDPQFKFLATLFAEMKPEIAFNEGGQFSRSRTYADFNSAILQNGEAGLLKYLCDSVGITMINGDMDTREEFSELLKTVPQDQLYLYMAVERFLNGYHDGYFGNDLDKAFQKEFIDYLKENDFPVTGEEQRFEYLQDLYRKHLDRNLVLDSLVPLHEYYLLDDGKFGDIGRQTKIVRDRALLQKIDSALTRYDRVFVVFGGAHRLAVEPALKQIINKH